MIYQLAAIFPTPNHAANIGIYQVGNGSAVPFSAIMINAVPDLHVTGAGSGGQFFPRWTYEKADEAGTLDFTAGTGVDEWGYRRVDNITDEILSLYRESVGDQVAKDDIFYYAYGTLHDPGYRSRYAADLKKLLPHIPTPDTLHRFQRVAEIGRQLADLHICYEEVKPYPLHVQLRAGAAASNRETWRVDKMKWKSKADRTAIVYNAAVTVTGIPDAAHDYMLGSRSALEWLMDRYQIKTDKASGIVNDPNDWCDEHDDPTYIVDLIKKVTTVSVSTVELVAQLAALNPSTPFTARRQGRGRELRRVRFSPA
jgi:predicted helicase